MKYIIMCGGQYQRWSTPRQLLKVNGEVILERTIRLLRENGVKDIAISSNNSIFGVWGLPLLMHENSYNANGYDNFTGYWCDAFYPTNEEVCYIFGDVYFSPEAIKTIVETDTDDIEFFASAPPFPPEYQKPWAEPFALKVKNTEHLKNAISLTKQYQDQGLFKRKPIMWELWQVIQATPLNQINYHNYTVINDYTCDIDYPEEVADLAP
jgi:hypothetical protein